MYDAMPLSGNSYKVTIAKGLLREAMAFLADGGGQIADGR
jgi:hypothetical protein